MSQAIDTFMHASKGILSECIKTIESDDPETFAGLSKAMQGGAYCEIRCCLSIIGANEVLINIVQPDGERINLGHIEFGVAPVMQ